MTVNGVIGRNDSDGCPLCRCCGVCFATQWYFLVATRKLESSTAAVAGSSDRTQPLGSLQRSPNSLAGFWGPLHSVKKERGKGKKGKRGEKTPK